MCSFYVLLSIICKFLVLKSISIQPVSCLQGPFTYEALPPEQIVFTPLKKKHSFNAKELMQVCKLIVWYVAMILFMARAPAWHGLYSHSCCGLTIEL